LSTTKYKFSDEGAIASFEDGGATVSLAPIKSEGTAYITADAPSGEGYLDHTNY